MDTVEKINKPYNSRIIDVYQKLIRDRYPDIDVEEILNYAEMEHYQVADQGHWFSQDQVDRFYEKLVQLTGNDRIAREAGQYAAFIQDGNIMRRYFLAMIGPSGAYDMVGKASTNFTRSSRFKARKLASNSVEIQVTPTPGVEEKPYQCENRAGMLEAISMIFNNKPPRLEHPECMFRGGKTCTYTISWEHSPMITLKKIRNYSILFSILVNAGLAVLFPILTVAIITPATVLGILIFSIIIKNRETREIKTSLRGIQSTTDELLKQINLNYNNTLIAHEIGQVINKHTTIEEVLKSVIQISEKRLDFDRGLILLANTEKTRLLFSSGFGYIDKYLNLLKETEFHLDKEESKGIFVISFKERRPFLINDLKEIKKDLSPRSLSFAKALGSKSFICCPIICDNESLGIFAVDNLHSQRPLVQSDMSLLQGIASVIGIAIKNARLLEAREKQFQSILKVLASSIDARDPLTSGHSEKVTKYALGICGEFGLSREYCEMIRIAALLHDYGKIGVPDHILKKNGKLTNREFSIIKTHAERTKTILDQVNFEGVYSAVPEIAGSHHERFDGDGYPEGLAGEQIPLGARIIAVADFFEAITARRHYRNPMSRDEAVKTLKKEGGDHLDSRIVEVFLCYLMKNGNGET